jgi:hypothetical protein
MTADHEHPPVDPSRNGAAPAAPPQAHAAAQGGKPGRVAEAPPPLPLRPRRKVDLTLAALPGPGSAREVDALAVRELKGVGKVYTPNLDVAAAYHGIAYKANGEFDTRYQIVAGGLLNDPRVMRCARPITFVPAYSWSTCEVVLAPFKRTSYDRRVLEDLRKLHPLFPRHKVFVKYDDDRKRHVVQYEDLTPLEAGVIAGVKWPTLEDVREALGDIAFDDLDELMCENEEIRALIKWKEVE